MQKLAEDDPQWSELLKEADRVAEELREHLGREIRAHAETRVAVVHAEAR